jgi:hypothetical protein
MDIIRHPSHHPLKGKKRFKRPHIAPKSRSTSQKNGILSWGLGISKSTTIKTNVPQETKL